MRVDFRPGWVSALIGLALAAITAALVVRWSVNAPWLTVRGSLIGFGLVGGGLVIGSSGLIGLASLPILTAAVVGIDRPVGHAWGQALVLAVLWYATAEVAWASVEARTDTVRAPAVERLRIREVATVVVVAVVVGAGGIALAALAPVRTATVRALAVAVVLIGLAAVGRQLANRTGPTGRRTGQPVEPEGEHR